MHRTVFSAMAAVYLSICLSNRYHHMQLPCMTGTEGKDDLIRALEQACSWTLAAKQNEEHILGFKTPGT